MNISVEVSASHIHLCDEDIKKLFPKGLTKKKDLSVRKEFAADQTVLLENKTLRVLGPAREKSQIELSMTDAYRLNLHLPIRISGNTKDAPKVEVSTNNTIIRVPAIIAKRHLHIDPKTAKQQNLKENDLISVRVDGERPLTFHDVVVRFSDTMIPQLHIDTDEGNAAGINKKTTAKLLL